MVVFQKLAQIHKLQNILSTEKLWYYNSTSEVCLSTTHRIYKGPSNILFKLQGGQHTTCSRSGTMGVKRQWCQVL